MPEIQPTVPGSRLSGPLPPAPAPASRNEPPVGPQATAAGEDLLTGSRVVPPSDRLQHSGAAQGASRPAVEVDATLQDVTLRAKLNESLTLSGRYVTDSPTMMEGAGLLKLDYQLGPQTTVFGGVGHMPGFYHMSIGPNEKVEAPTSAMFLGVADQRRKDWDLGQGVHLDVGLNTLAVATVAYDHAIGGVDSSTMAGLSKGTLTGEANLSREFGPAKVWLGYGNHVDLGHVGSYYVTGGRGLAPQTQYAQGGVQGTAGDFRYEAAAYVPISTATNDFAADPRFMARVDGKAIPTLTLQASMQGLERVEASKSFAFGNGWEATAAVAVNQPGRLNDVQAAVGLRFNFGGGGRKSTPLDTPDYRRESALPRRQDPIRSSSPHLRDYFTPAEIAAMRGKSVEELGAILKTPEQVTAYVGDLVDYDYARLKDAKGNYGSMTPNEVAKLLSGVCRDQHPMLIEVMKQGQGIEGHAVGYTSPETSHAIAVYQDPASKKWNVIEYGKIHYTEAASAEAAFEAVRPDALVYGNWSQNGPDRRNYQADIRYSETAREFYRFVQPTR